MPNGDEVGAALLQFNYLPRQKKSADEMPPLFTSIDFTMAIADALKSAPNSSPKAGYDAIEVGQTRADGKRRPISIPHPSAYASVVRTLRDNWSELDSVFDNKRSRLRPRLFKDGRIFVMNYGDWNTKTLGHIRESFEGRFLVRADVANFFGSIYTHSIPWALVGIAAAKAAIGRSEWFNDIDASFQLCKRRETNGIAIGPGASNVVAEIILGKVDEKLSRYKFHRYIDDYVAVCETREECDDFLRSLEKSLGIYKLSLNHRKTEIVTLPTPTSSDWVVKIRRIIKELPDPVTPSAAVALIDESLEIASATGNPNIIKYVFRALATKNLHYWSASVILEYGLTLVNSFPAVLSSLDIYLSRGKGTFSPLIISEKINSILLSGVSKDRTDQVSWCLYYLEKIGVSIQDEIIIRCIQSRDCLTILLCYRYSSTLQRKLFKDFINRLMRASDIHDKHQYWMLIYELYCCGDIKRVGEDTGVFSILKSHGVRFVPSLV